MPAAKVLRAACLALGLALATVSCSFLQGDAGRDGVRGGTLRVLSATPAMDLDTASVPELARTYARTLYGYNLAGPRELATVPVPDIADSPAQLSADRRTYTFTLRAGVRYAPRSTARSPPPTSSPPSSGSTTRRAPRTGSHTPTSSPGPDGSPPARPAASRAWPPPTPAPSPSPWTSPPPTSCPSSPSRCSPRCPGSTRPTMRSGTTTRGMWSAPA